MIEIQPQLFVDGLIHPVFRLFVAPIVEIAIGLHEIKILVYHIPHLLYTRAVETTIAEHLWCPATLRHGEEMQGITEIGGSHLTTVHIITITFIDDDTIGNLHDTTLDTLQLIASTSHLYQQEEVYHRVTGRFTLTYPHRLHEYLVEPCSLTKDDGLTCLSCHTTQRASRRTRTDKRIRMYGQFLHTCLITQNTSLGTLTAGVDSQYRQAAAFLLQQMNAKLINRGRLTRSRHNLLRLSLMVGIHTLYQRHRLRENRHVTFHDTLNHLADAQLTPAETVTLQVRVDDRRLLYPTIHQQASIFSTILGMLHFFVVSLFRCSVISLFRYFVITLSRYHVTSH